MPCDIILNGFDDVILVGFDDVTPILL